MIVLAAEEPLPIIPILSELILGTIAFAILLTVLWKFAVPRFEKAYEQRTDAIEGGLKRAQEAQEEADRKKQEYDDLLAGAQAEASRIRDDARMEAQQIKAELREEAEQEVARLKARGQEQIEASREQAERNLRGEIGGLSVQLAERLIGDSLADESRRSATVDSFLGELDGMARQRSGTG